MPRIPAVLPLLVVLSSLFLSACSGGSSVKPYRIDVSQGNVITQEMVAQLKPGLTKDQVRFVLGSPLVTDMFHSDRWDYVYHFQPGGKGEPQNRRLTVIFEDNKLARLAGDVVAGDGWLESAGQAKPAVREIDIPAEPKKGGFFGK